MSTGNEDWRFGLTDGCYMALCTPCAMGEVAQWTGKSCGLWTALNWFLPCCALTALRTTVRERQNIPGNVCGDCMVSFCCYPCAAEQIYVEKAAVSYEERRTQKRMAAMYEQQAMGRMMSPGMGMAIGNNNANNVGQTSVVNVSLSPTPQQQMPPPAVASPAYHYPEAQAVQHVVPMAAAFCPPKDMGMVTPAPPKAAY